MYLCMCCCILCIRYGDLASSVVQFMCLLLKSHQMPHDASRYLTRLPVDLMLQSVAPGVHEAAPHYQYYQMDEKMKDIPIEEHVLPDGAAMVQLSDMLQQRKDYGIMKIHDECSAERQRKDHKYIANYPCQANIRRQRRRLRSDPDASADALSAAEQGLCMAEVFANMQFGNSEMDAAEDSARPCKCS